MTSPTSPARRSLRFEGLDDILRDVALLRENGYDRAGNWSLAQICSHLADWMSFPLDGFPKAPAPIRAALWIMKHTFARRGLRKALKTGATSTGVPTIPQTVAAPGMDEAIAVERLRRVVARFKSHTGPLHPSPLFGDLDRETTTRLHLIHCAHHLSFLIPKAG